MGADQMVIDELEDLFAEAQQLAATRPVASNGRPGPKLRDIRDTGMPLWLISAKYGIDLISLTKALHKAEKIENDRLAEWQKRLAGEPKLRLMEDAYYRHRGGERFETMAHELGRSAHTLKKYVSEYEALRDNLNRQIDINYEWLDSKVVWWDGWDRSNVTYTDEQLAELYASPYNWSIGKIAAETGWHYRKVREHLRKAGAYARKHGKPVDNL